MLYREHYLYILVDVPVEYISICFSSITFWFFSVQLFTGKAELSLRWPFTRGHLNIFDRLEAFALIWTKWLHSNFKFPVFPDNHLQKTGRQLLKYINCYLKPFLCNCIESKGNLSAGCNEIRDLVVTRSVDTLACSVGLEVQHRHRDKNLLTTFMFFCR